MGKGFSFRWLILTNIHRKKAGVYYTNGGSEALLGYEARLRLRKRFEAYPIFESTMSRTLRSVVSASVSKATH